MRFDPILGRVDSITFSPSGKFMAVVQGRATGSPTTLFLRSSNAGYIATLQGTNPLFSPDEQLIATTHYSATQQNTLLWSSTDGTRTATLVGHSPRFSPTGFFVVTEQRSSAGHPSTMLWHSETGTLLRDLRGHAPTFNPDGQWLAIATSNEVHLWSLAGSKLATSHLVVAKDIQVESMAFSPDGKHLRMAAANGLHVWNVLNDSLFSNLAVGGTLNSSHNVLVNIRSGEDGLLRGVQIIDPENGKILYEDREIVFAGGSPGEEKTHATQRLVGFNSSVTTATLVSREGVVRLANLRSGETLELALPGVEHMAFNPNGATLAISRPGKQIELWNVAEDAAAQSLDSPEGGNRPPRALHFGPGGHQLFVEEEIIEAGGVTELAVNMWQVPTDTLGSTIWQTGLSPASDQPSQRLWDFSPVISTTIWVNQSNQVQLAAVSGTSLTLTEPGTYTAMDFSPDGQLMAVANQYGTIQLLKTEGGYLFDTLQAEGAVDAVQFSADGTLLGAHHTNGTLLVWRVGEQTPMSSMATSADDRFTFSPDNQILLAGGPQHMTFYRTSDGVVLERLNVAAQHVAFSADQRLLATLSDERVVVWGVR
jgi:WD40 repeat protein